jgi:hypothetical protein
MFLVTSIGLFFWFYEDLKRIKSSSLFFKKKEVDTLLICPYKTFFLNVCQSTPMSVWPILYLSKFCDDPYSFFMRFAVVMLGIHMLMSLIFNQLLAAFFALGISTFVLFLFVYEAANNNKKRLQKSLPLAIRLMKNSLQSGQSLKKGFELVVKEISGPIQDIFKEILLNTNLGIDLDTALKKVSDKIQVEEFSLLLSALSINSKNGGNLINTLDKLEIIINERHKTEKKVLISISSSKTEGGIAIGVTLFLLGFMLTADEKTSDYFLYSEDGVFYLKILGLLLLLNCFTVFYVVKWAKAQ